MKKIISFGVNMLLMWAAILIGSILGASVLNMGAETVETDGPLTAEQAFLAVNAINALILAIVAANARIRGWNLALLIAGTLFFVQSIMFLLEAVYFQNSLDVPLDLLLKGAVQALIVAIIAGGVAALLWRSVPPQRSKPASLSPLWARILIVSGLYVIAYFLAGFYIAWADADVRAYYSFGDNIDLLPLLAFQLFRGMLWAFLALWIVGSLNGSLMSRATLVGLAFSVLGIAPLLYPNAFMPWAVRFPHMIEIGASNFIFGAAAGYFMQLAKPGNQ